MIRELFITRILGIYCNEINYLTMKQILIVAFIFSLLPYSFGQVAEYENGLALYISNFKQNAYYDEIRLNLLDKVSSMKDQINAQINNTEHSHPEYKRLVTIQEITTTFYNYLRCFSGYAVNSCQIEEFNLIMNLLGIVPKELENLKCDLATFYEITINDFKAVLVYNRNEYQEIPGQKTIRVEYDVLVNGKAVSGSYLNVGANQIRCIKYLSDMQTFYPKIVAVRCSNYK